MMGANLSSDTIFAPATARGRAGVAVVRVSGPHAADCLIALTGKLPRPRLARLCALRDGSELIDRGLVIWFPGPQSFTGEDVAELHIHGSHAVMAHLLDTLGRLPHCRIAEPGEFTRRAFHHQKMDLTEAEGLADLIAADTAAQRRQALQQMNGSLARTVEQWTEQAIRALAYCEAVIDFSDEELPIGLWDDIRRNLQQLADSINQAMADGNRGEIVRDGLSVALVGPPNSGKSSLLNKLAGRDVAIVSAHAGTTRDIVEVRLDLGGYAILLADTAGIRITDDPIEQEGMRRAKARAESADLTLFIVDSSDDVSRETSSLVTAGNNLSIWNKIDLKPAPPGEIGISAETGAGIDRLIQKLTDYAAARLSGETVLVTRNRHRVALQDCLNALYRAINCQELGLFAEDLRIAVRALGRVTGKVDVEDLLDVIFRDFCIGK